ncbi:MAG: flagellar basal body rod protein FlgB [Granulosicoccus sp.]
MIDKFLATHANALQMRARRTKVLASNIANADTPNYKARDLAFAEVLRDVNKPGAGNAFRSKKLALSSSSLLTTNSRHIKKDSSSVNAPLMYRQPQQASLDGNTVDKDLEQARFAENTVRYQATLEFINSRVGGLMRTLRSE